MRLESLYLNDIVEAADHIAEFISGVEFVAFRESELLRSAVVQKLAVIGEAAGRVSEELKGRNGEVPWPQIIAFRNWFTRILESTGISYGRAVSVRCPLCASRSRES